MTHEVHGIVEQPQNLDRFPAFVIADPEQDEVTHGRRPTGKHCSRRTSMRDQSPACISQNFAGVTTG